MGVGLHSMHNSSHASKLSLHIHLSVASRRASTSSKYLPSTSFRHAHTRTHVFFVTLPLLSSMMRMLSFFCHTPSASSHGDHTRLFFAVDNGSCTSSSAGHTHAPTFFNVHPLPLQLRLLWLVVLTWSIHFPSQFQARLSRSCKWGPGPP